MNSNYDALEKAITQFINDDALKGKAIEGSNFIWVNSIIKSMKTLSDLTSKSAIILCHVMM